MDGAKPKPSEEWVPLWQAGIPETDIRRQVETLCHSTAFENQSNAKNLLRHLVEKSLSGTMPRVAEIAREVFGKKNFDAGDSQVRVETGHLRDYLAEHYASAEAKPEEIEFSIPPRQYVIFAPKSSSSESLSPRRIEPRTGAAITEPEEDALVYQRVKVRGYIEGLDLDLRAWLVVRTPCGDLYPQCRVSRNQPEWEQEVRIGRRQWGSDENTVHEIDLVAADVDADVAFHLYLKSNRDGFGPLLPSDCRVIAARKVMRRDLRPESAG